MKTLELDIVDDLNGFVKILPEYVVLHNVTKRPNVDSIIVKVEDRKLDEFVEWLLVEYDPDFELAFHLID